jgi:hypothetical protein
MEISKDIKWSPILEGFFKDMGEKSYCYGYLHKKCEARYAYKRNFIDLPVIVLSTIAGTLSIGSDSIFGKENATQASMGIGVLSLFVSVMNTVGTYFSWSKRSENHRQCSLQYEKLYRFLDIELSLPQEERMNPSDLLKISRETYEKLAETSPLIPKEIIKEFRVKFKNHKVSKPSEANGLEVIDIYDINRPTKYGSSILGSQKNSVNNDDIFSDTLSETFSDNLSENIKIENFVNMSPSKLKKYINKSNIENNINNKEIKNLISTVKNNEENLLSLLNKNTNNELKKELNNLTSLLPKNNDFNINIPNNNIDIFNNNQQKFFEIKDNFKNNINKISLNTIVEDEEKNNFLDTIKNVKDTILDKVKDDVKDTILDKVKDDVKDTILDKVKDDVKDTILDKVKDDVKDTILDKVKDDVKDFILDKVKDDVKDFILDKVKDVKNNNDVLDIV